MAFTPRYSKPGKGNKFYITTSKGGYSRCIVGKPTDNECNVLANCVGYACGRFNEIIGKMKYSALNCNAENFIERAKSLGLVISNIPHKGGIMVWQKGSLSSSDGAGHVAIVEDIKEWYDSKPSKIITSESGYNYKSFWTTIRTNSNGRWGQSSNYKFRGCIINPSVPDEPTPKPSKLKYKIGDRVVINGQLYGNADGGNPGKVVHNKVTNITRAIENKKCPYNTTGDLGWMKEEEISLYEDPSVNLKVGDKVKIVKPGNGSSDGTSNTAYGIGWTRTIKKIYVGRKFPYQVGDANSTVGFYTADALVKR